DYLFSQGFSPDIPQVRHIYYYNHGSFVDGDMNGTMLDFVENSVEIPHDLKLNLLDVLHDHGALRYRELVKEHPELPHLDMEGVHIPQRLMWIMELLQQSPKADCYRLRNGGVIGFSDNDLVLEAGIKDPESGKLAFEKHIEMPRRNEDGTIDESAPMVQVPVPLVYRMIFHIPSPEEIRERKKLGNQERYVFWKEQFVFPQNDDKFFYYENMTRLGWDFCDVYYQSSSLGGTKKEREAFFNDHQILDRMFEYKYEDLPRHQRPYSGIGVSERSPQTIRKTSGQMP
ncbi:MAG: hypothetical protein IKR81_00995, partial [Victivallales bacterium]|nr:hypothetical protein [Victivallales bacterium]